jgi:ATP-dependent Clp protease ATP-binding subunit ClpA
MLDGFEPFNEASRRVLFYARSIVSELGGNAIEPEHLLLGLMRTQPEVVISTLAKRTSADDMIRALRGRVAQNEKVPKEVDIPFSETTEEVLVKAVEEARGQDTLVVPEHILLACSTAGPLSAQSSGRTASRLLAFANNCLVERPDRERFRRKDITRLDTNQLCAAEDPINRRAVLWRGRCALCEATVSAPLRPRRR